MPGLSGLRLPSLSISFCERSLRTADGSPGQKRSGPLVWRRLPGSAAGCKISWRNDEALAPSHRALSCSCLKSGHLSNSDAVFKVTVIEAVESTQILPTTLILAK